MRPAPLAPIHLRAAVPKQKDAHPAMKADTERRLSLILSERLALFAEPIDPQADLLSCLCVDGGLEAHANAWRRPSRDDVTRVQRHDAAKIADDLWHREDHCAG